MNFAKSLPIEIANATLAERAAAANNNNYALGGEEVRSALKSLSIQETND